MPRPLDFLWLNIDRRFTEAGSWEPWLKHVARTRKAFARFIDLDPMTNETASCGVLAAAASSSGLLAMTEYICIKKHKTDYRKRGHGRADLWVADPRRSISWAFEAKQLRCAPGTRTATIEAAMASACHDASRLTDVEADRFYGLLIVTLPAAADPDALHALCERLDDFGEASWIGCKFGGGAQPAYAFICPAERSK